MVPVLAVAQGLPALLAAEAGGVPGVPQSLHLLGSKHALATLGALQRAAAQQRAPLRRPTSFRRGCGLLRPRGSRGSFPRGRGWGCGRRRLRASCGAGPPHFGGRSGRWRGLGSFRSGHGRGLGSFRVGCGADAGVAERGAEAYALGPEELGVVGLAVRPAVVLLVAPPAQGLAAGPAAETQSVPGPAQRLHLLGRVDALGAGGALGVVGLEAPPAGGRPGGRRRRSLGSLLERRHALPQRRPSLRLCRSLLRGRPLGRRLGRRRRRRRRRCWGPGWVLLRQRARSWGG
mmetsp:Transcript_86879/g.259204  ORF Transcript_86879/g.259204 Transcript_86879/m.259204 type:complete len:289 (+) Transcript_86879:517-1383(+)